MQRRTLSIFLLCVALALPGFALTARAAGPLNPVTPADAKAVRAVIQAQLDAFGADDAERAFGLAVPALREMFGSADKFIAMVRKNYPVVYRPASVGFLQPEQVDADVLQRVQMTDASGRAWTAIYRVQRQADGAWRIAGCEVVEATGRFT